jgi:uroporphyrin-3 C-methyltransferase
MTNQNETSLEQQVTIERRGMSRKQSFFTTVTLLLALLTICALAWQWYTTRQRFIALEQTLTQRLEDYGSNNQRVQTLAKLSTERSVEAIARIALLEQKLAESRDQQESLQTIYRELSNNREERVISEVEQLMIIANQQLLLAANVKPALLALQTADTRLQQLDTAQAIQLRKSLAQDIQRLQSLPLVDTAGASLRLENLADSVDELPLVSDRHPTATPVPAPTWESSRWRRFVQEVWHDLKRMVRLERIDRPEPPLLAPVQEFFLRENIKLRLLTARIALLQHDEASYRADLLTAEHWLRNYFDLRESATKTALTTIQQLSSSNIVIELPDISESLGLVNRYKITLDHGDSQSQDR